MKVLSVFLLCTYIYSVNTYTIFPLPGQSVGVNPKFSGFTQQTTRAPVLNSRLGNLEPRPFQPQTFRIPEVNIGSTRPLATTQSIATLPSQATRVEVQSASSASDVGSTLKFLASPGPGFDQNPQSFVPSKFDGPLPTPANDLLPPKEDPKPELTTTTVAVPLKPAVEVPYNDLLPPKIIKKT